MHHDDLIAGAIREYRRSKPGKGGTPDPGTSTVIPSDVYRNIVVLRDAAGVDLAVVMCYTSAVYKLRDLAELPQLVEVAAKGVFSPAIMTDLCQLNRRNLQGRIRHYQMSARILQEERAELLHVDGTELRDYEADMVDWMSRREDADRALAAWLEAEAVIALTPALARIEAERARRQAQIQGVQ